MPSFLRNLAPAALAVSMVAIQPAGVVHAQDLPAANPGQPSYADLVDLADSADLVLRAKIRRLVRVEDERAPGLAPGRGRYYVEAQTLSLLAGSRGVGDSLVYLVDLPLDARGKPPPLKKQDVLLFARPVSGHPNELQLVAPSAQILWSEPAETTVRTILTELLSPDAPPVVTGVREIIHVPGNLAGSGETQIFLSTQDRSAASITVRHQPGQPPAWGVSFSELVADVTRPPRRGTLEWYRLACALPNTLPPKANLSESASSRQQAVADYHMVLGELGVCRRNLG